MADADLVLERGGVKGTGLVGAITALTSAAEPYTFQRAAGAYPRGQAEAVQQRAGIRKKFLGKWGWGKWQQGDLLQATSHATSR